MSVLKHILEKRAMACCSDCGMKMKMQQGSCPDCGASYGLGMGAKDAPGMSEEKEEEPTSDFKLDKLGRKIKASRIVFNKGEDDSTKKVQENMKITYKDMINAYSAMRVESLQLEDEINEVLSKDAAAGDWISDFVKSDNPKFAGKSKEKRKQMALAAYYAKQKNEEVDMDEELKGGQVKLDKNKNGKLDAEDFKKLRKEDAEIDEAEYKISTAQMGHAGKTTIKHIKNPDVTQRMAAHDVKSYADRIALLKDAKRKGNLKEEEMNEELHPDADKVLKHIKPEHHAKYTPDLTTKHYTGNYADRTAVLKAAERAGHLKESVFDWKKNPKETSDKTKTSTYHDVKKVSTGTVYTKQFDKDGTSKGTGGDAAAKAENAPKRGRGRPKKDKFAESVEILMSLSEEQFDSMMEEGFDAFFEAYEQLDELSKTTLGSYAKKAAVDAKFKGFDAGSQQGHAMANSKEMYGGIDAGSETDEKAHSRLRGVKKAIDRLTK